MQGLFLGSVVSYFTVKTMEVTNIFHRVAVFFSITILIGFVYYLAMPKSDYILRHLNTKEQQETWLEIYKTMKGRYLAGFLIGALSSVPVSFALC
jgi:uncharacterized protein YacL